MFKKLLLDVLDGSSKLQDGSDGKYFREVYRHKKPTINCAITFLAFFVCLFTL